MIELPRVPFLVLLHRGPQSRYGKELTTKQMQKLQARREHALMLHLSGLLQRHVDGDVAGFKVWGGSSAAA